MDMFQRKLSKEKIFLREIEIFGMEEEQSILLTKIMNTPKMENSVFFIKRRSIIYLVIP